MSTTHEAQVYKAADATHIARAATAGHASLAWMSQEAAGRALLSGYAAWDEAEAPPKTLDYEEVILVLEGTFGVQLDDGRRLVAKAGDVLHIPCGTTVRYEGVGARLFFVTTSGPVEQDVVR